MKWGGCRKLQGSDAMVPDQCQLGGIDNRQRKKEGMKEKKERKNEVPPTAWPKRPFNANERREECYLRCS